MNRQWPSPHELTRKYSTPADLHTPFRWPRETSDRHRRISWSLGRRWRNRAGTDTDTSRRTWTWWSYTWLGGLCRARQSSADRNAPLQIRCKSWTINTSVLYQTFQLFEVSKVECCSWQPVYALQWDPLHRVTVNPITPLENQKKLELIASYLNVHKIFRLNESKPAQ